MNILFTICGRAGSKGVKNKNLKSFIDIPLVYYTLAAIALYTKENPETHCDVALNTDSETLIELIKKVEQVPVQIVKRPAELAGDIVAKKDVIAHTLINMEVAQGIVYDMIVDLDITPPLRTLADVTALIDKFLKSDVDVVFTVAPARRSPYFNMVSKSESGEVRKIIDSNFVARQEAPQVYDMNASIYAYKREFLLSDSYFFDGKLDFTLMKDTGILDIDSEEDFELMEVIAKHLYDTEKAYKAVYQQAKKWRPKM